MPQHSTSSRQGYRTRPGATRRWVRAGSGACGRNPGRHRRKAPRTPRWQHCDREQRIRASHLRKLQTPCLRRCSLYAGTSPGPYPLENLWRQIAQAVVRATRAGFVGQRYSAGGCFSAGLQEPAGPFIPRVPAPTRRPYSLQEAADRLNRRQSPRATGGVCRKKAVPAANTHYS